MYDIGTYKIDWISKFKKALIFLVFIVFCLLLIYIYSNKNLNTKVDYFQDNLDTLSSVARIYYQQNTDNYDKTTLENLIEEKKIINFIDEDGNTCDIKNSYIMKQNNVVKVHLSCSNTEDDNEFSL